MAKAKMTPAMTSATYLEAVRAARRQGQRHHTRHETENGRLSSTTATS